MNKKRSILKRVHRFKDNSCLEVSAQKADFCIATDDAKHQQDEKTKTNQA